jgi:hypothetical protein
VFLGQVFMECMKRMKDGIASLDTLPPLAMSLQFVLKPFMS